MRLPTQPNPTSVGWLCMLLTLLFSQAALSNTFYKGVDLSYVNQVEDNGAVFKVNGVTQDPYAIMYDYGANLVRIRLWHNPNWLDFAGNVNTYSNYADAKRSIARAKANGMQVLLDFHYSDNWADPSHQRRPFAWDSATTLDQLKVLLYNYTFQTLRDLDAEGLMPELVQIGNETNNNMAIGPGEPLSPVNYARQAALMNEGIRAVKDAGALGSLTPKTIIHIANPAHVYGFFAGVRNAGLTGYDIIGMSYYYHWHGYSINQTAALIAQLKQDFQKDVMIVEVSHPWTTEGIDPAGNIINDSAPGYPAPSPQVQKDYLIDLTTAVAQNGGLGVIYWEPLWISSNAYTQWGHGSHWENQTFFDFNGELMIPGGVEFLAQDYPTVAPEPTAKLTLKVDMTGVDVSQGVYVTGSFSGAGNWALVPMTLEGNNIYTHTAEVAPGAEGAYYFLNANSWSARETVPAECAPWWGVDRGFIANGDVTYAVKWGSCAAIANPEVMFVVDMTGVNTANGVYITGSFTGTPNWKIVPMSTTDGRIYYHYATLPAGSTGAYYFLNGNNWAAREQVPTECALMWNTDRAYSISHGTSLIRARWNSCSQPEVGVFEVDMTNATPNTAAYISGALPNVAAGSNVPMKLKKEKTFVYATGITLPASGSYYYLTGSSANTREKLPAACTLLYGGKDRKYSFTNSRIQKDAWRACY
ncbi:glycosyl hydrolase 53 family protein [Cellvibrio sp. KY-YJ-3]|uniref:glycoside hydrolase family 53 protein n=1 Tax=Cellvibrio sp. KY-YJ-3 TaxID=454662 RepID=UPI001246EB0E|nr:glycosyl hydrolase 53 family protein [Cellvibrio sp. KY-YJ-3]QEY14044.1 hypothetical protein D0B88_18320 [Cellvibrio sp. KY-YJ-3]